MLKILYVSFKDKKMSTPATVDKNTINILTRTTIRPDMNNQIQLMWACKQKNGFCRVQSLYSVRLCPQKGWDRAPSGTVPGTLGHQDRSKPGWLVGANKRHVLVHNHKHTHVNTPSVIKKNKNMITNTVEVITFLATSYMSTHAEHLCPPPFIVLLCLILFSSEMIMISLAAKYECKFISLVPAKTHSVYWSVIMVCRQTGKEHF